MLRQVQALFHANRERLAAEASHAVPVAVGVSALHQARVGQTAQREESGREIVNQLEIAKTYKNPASHDPVLLGSSIKGAIRTALLDAVNGGQPLAPDERARLEHGRAGEQASVHRDLQIRLFRYRNSRGKVAFEMDPMRLVQIADAPYTAADGIPRTEVRFAVNRKKHAVILAGQEVRSQAEQSNLQQIIETVLPMRFRAFTGGLTLQRPVDGPGATDKVPAADLRWSVEKLVDACNRFYWPKLDHELEALRSRGFLEDAWQDAMQGLVLAGLKQRLDSGRAFLLRVGRHSGAEAVTLDGVRYIKIMRGRGEPPEHSIAAKTWWLAAPETGDRRNLVPFGWLLVELIPVGAEPQSWPAAGEAAARYGERFAAWRDDLLVRKSSADARRSEEARRLADEQERARAAEAAARELEISRATMSPQARELDELRTQFERDRVANRREPGGRTAGRLAALLRAAEGWSDSDRLPLAGLAEEMYAFLGWGDGAKKKKKRSSASRAFGVRHEGRRPR